MSLWGDVEEEMERTSLDPEIAEQILAGTVMPDDLPVEYRDLAALVETARAEARPEELAGEEETVAAMTAVLRARQPQESSTRWRNLLMLPRLASIKLATGRRPKLAIALVATLLAATTGVAFAGALPTPAQNLAANVLGPVGVPDVDDDEQEDQDVLAVAAQDGNEADLVIEVVEQTEAPAQTQGEGSTEPGPEWLRLAVENAADDDEAEDDEAEEEADDDEAEDEADDDEAHDASDDSGSRGQSSEGAAPAAPAGVDEEEADDEDEAEEEADDDEAENDVDDEDEDEDDDNDDDDDDDDEDEEDGEDE